MSTCADPHSLYRVGQNDFFWFKFVIIFFISTYIFFYSANIICGKLDQWQLNPLMCTVWCGVSFEKISGVAHFLWKLSMLLNFGWCWKMFWGQLCKTIHKCGSNRMESQCILLPCTPWLCYGTSSTCVIWRDNEFLCIKPLPMRRFYLSQFERTTVRQ